MLEYQFAPLTPKLNMSPHCTNNSIQCMNSFPSASETPVDEKLKFPFVEHVNSILTPQSKLVCVCTTSINKFSISIRSIFSAVSMEGFQININCPQRRSTWNGNLNPFGNWLEFYCCVIKCCSLSSHTHRHKNHLKSNIIAIPAHIKSYSRPQSRDRFYFPIRFRFAFKLFFIPQIFPLMDSRRQRRLHSFFIRPCGSILILRRAIPQYSDDEKRHHSWVGTFPAYLLHQNDLLHLKA